MQIRLCKCNEWSGSILFTHVFYMFVVAPFLCGLLCVVVTWLVAGWMDLWMDSSVQARLDMLC